MFRAACESSYLRVYYIYSEYLADCVLLNTRKSTTLDGKLIYSIIENSHEKKRGVSWNTVRNNHLKKTQQYFSVFGTCFDVLNIMISLYVLKSLDSLAAVTYKQPYQKVTLKVTFNHWSHIVNNLFY